MFDKIASKLVESETIPEEDKELYEYGLRQVASTFATAATTLVIGFILGMVLASALFMASYIPLRSYAGGYHARTPLRCYIFSLVLTVGVLLGIRYFPHDLALTAGLVLAAGAIILVFAPFADENKPLDEIEKKVFRKRMRIVLFAEIVLISAFWALGWTWVAVCIAVSVAVAGLMVIVGLLRNAIRRSKRPHTGHE